MNTKLTRIVAVLFCCLSFAYAAPTWVSIRKHVVAVQQTQAANGAQLSVANSATLPVPSGSLTAGSFVFVAIPQNCGSVTVSIMGSYVGQAHVYTSTGTLGSSLVSPRFDQLDGVGPGSSQIPANTNGTWTFSCPQGSAGVILTSLTGTNYPYVVLIPGPTLTPTDRRPAHQANPPSNFATGTNWTLSTGAQTIWIPLASSSTCSIVITDQFGTVSTYSVVNGTFWPVPIQGAITINSPSAGSSPSTNLPTTIVVSY